MYLGNIMNPARKNIGSDVKLRDNMQISDVGLPMLAVGKDEYIEIVDSHGNSVGGVKKERLEYVLSMQFDSSLINILDYIDEGVIAVDKDSRIFYVNPAYEKILGVAIGKIIGRYLKAVEPGAQLLDVLENRQETFNKKVLIQTVGKYVSVHMCPIYTKGRFAGAFSIFTDTTEVNQLTKEVRRISNVAMEYNMQLESLKTLSNNKVIGQSPVYINCISKATIASQTDAIVLLRGENGVGKEVVARLIKENSERKDKPFITVNCSAIPESLIESELFGYEEGAFTGAKKGGQLGKFQVADGGTLFLDEIGDMPLSMQAKLLRVLQNGEIEKIGRQNNIPVDVRVVAATNKHLEEMIEKREFRSDLYYRLNVISITIPPLRERGNDIILLADYFLSVYCEKYGKKVDFSESVYQYFLSCQWPGNVRELQNAVESAVVLCQGDKILLRDLPERLLVGLPPEIANSQISLPYGQYTSLSEKVDAFEREVIEQTLQKMNGDKERAIRELGISKRTFYRKLSGVSI